MSPSDAWLYRNGVGSSARADLSPLEKLEKEGYASVHIDGRYNSHLVMKELKPVTETVAIDPGTTESALVRLADDMSVWSIKGDNDQVRALLEVGFFPRSTDLPVLNIEMIASYGLPVGAEVFRTVLWIGRFSERWISFGGKVNYVFRREVKMFLCGSMKAKDGNIRQAIIDMYSGKEKAIGNKATPGPLYGIKSDMWAALGVALTAKGALGPRAMPGEWGVK